MSASDAQRFARVDTVFRELCRPGAPVLELGCGDGRVLEMLRAAGHRVFGVDLDPEALRAARRRNLSQAVIRADAERLPFVGATFGTVVSGFFSANLMDREAMVSEAARVLQPGGALAYTMMNPTVRVLDLAQRRLRRLALPRPAKLLAHARRLGDPGAEPARMRRHGLVPLRLRGPLYLPGLRRFGVAQARAPMVSGPLRALAWEVVAAGIRPWEAASSGSDADRATADALRERGHARHDGRAARCLKPGASLQRGLTYLVAQPTGLQWRTLTRSEITARGIAYVFGPEATPTWRAAVVAVAAA